MPARLVRYSCLIVGLLLVSGCSPVSGRLSYVIEASEVVIPASLELHDTPFYPQEDWQCGPAALSSLLVNSGVEIVPEELAGKIYLPHRRGSLQLELVAASRRYQRLPYVLDSNLMALLAELSAGRPVLVLQNLGLENYPVWHYSVLIGYDSVQDEIVLRSGVHNRRVIGFGHFMRSWEKGGRWAMVTLRPGEVPGLADATRYIQAVADLERFVAPDVAGDYYDAALARWPDNFFALFGRANVHYVKGELPQAEDLFRKLLAIEPDHPAARNNLAQLLADRGCLTEAMGEIESALALLDSDNPLRPNLLETRRFIQDRYSDDKTKSLACPLLHSEEVR